jgi:hypothetical protein
MTASQQRRAACSSWPPASPGVPVSLYDTLPGIDHRNASLVVKAIAHATGQAGRVITHPDGC